jgi:hypothetical protein
MVDLVSLESKVMDYFWKDYILTTIDFFFYGGERICRLIFGDTMLERYSDSNF